MASTPRRAARPRAAARSADAEAEAEQVAERATGPAGAGSETPAREDPAALSGVRLHRDDAAARLTEALGARAVTAGTDIFFGADAPAPETRDGRRLLAHELAHVVQQRSAGPAVQLFGRVSAPRSRRTWPP